MPRFKATIDAEGPNGAWAMMTIPANVVKSLKARSRSAVRGTINRYAFRGTIMPRADGSYYMMVNRAMRAGAGARPGDIVSVVMQRDDTPGDFEPPAELREALAKDRRAKAAFDALPQAQREAHARWVADAKREATRDARAAKVVALLGA